MFSLDQHLLRAVEAAWIWIAGDSVSHCYLFLVSPLEGSDDMSTYSHPAEVYVSMFLSLEILYLYSAKCAPKEHSMILEWVYSKYINEAGIMIFLSPFRREAFCYSDDRKKGSSLFQMRIVLWFFLSLSMIVGQKKRREKKVFWAGLGTLKLPAKTTVLFWAPRGREARKSLGFPPLRVSLFPRSLPSSPLVPISIFCWLRREQLRGTHELTEH